MKIKNYMYKEENSIIPIIIIKPYLTLLPFVLLSVVLSLVWSSSSRFLFDLGGSISTAGTCCGLLFDIAVVAAVAVGAGGGGAGIISSSVGSIIMGDGCCEFRAAMEALEAEELEDS